MDFMMYPTTVKMLAAEIISVCNAYVSRQITADDLKRVILHYAEYSPEMLFNGDELNSTVLNRIGKKRTVLVKKMLTDYQQKLHID